MLIFEAENPPSGISADIPYTLRDDSGGEWRFSLHIETVQELPAFAMSLAGAYPNPFNPGTAIRYDLHESAAVRLVVYDILGRRIKILEEGYRHAGIHEVRWDGTDDSGEKVSSGVYFCRMEAGGGVKTMKMTLME